MSKEHSEQLHELKTWESLIQSEGWQVYLKLKEDHKKHLVAECLRCVANGDFHNAVRHEAKVEDVEKELGLIRQGLKKLREEA